MTIEPNIKEEAEQRQLSGKPSAESAEGQSRDKVANYLGIGHDKLSKIENIVNAAKSNPKQFGNLLDKIDSGEGF